MIIYLATQSRLHAIEEYLSTWGQELAERVLPLSYAALYHRRTLPVATYIFADVERLQPAQATELLRLREVVEAPEGAGGRTLNHPTWSPRRYELLRSLHECGQNRFDAYRATEGRPPRRLPVFLCAEDGATEGSELIWTRGELDARLRALRDAGSIDNRLIIEFLDTMGVDRLYRQYSAFCVDGVIVPHHVFFSHEWRVDRPDLLDADLLREEQAYLTSNPHREQLEALCRLLRIEYGRIDYGVLEGQVQIWSIDTNPSIVSLGSQTDFVRLMEHSQFSSAFAGAMQRIDCAASGALPNPLYKGPAPVPVRIAAKVKRAVSGAFGFLLGAAGRA